ncbi:hypothetical protein PS732_03402 [Pseudomonas fluorescens]|uniref:Uncharacterized protein n=1 Tax=Pseudomonas fluorescens TaxID=294 RepID=A0ABD7VI44_PSEFL|nr:hypothetical protein PS732_03402 [Pseudomonas fluorescens]
MARNKDIPRVSNPPAGDGHHVTCRYMTARELAERDARQNAYDAMLARQDAFERAREVAAKKPEPIRAGCVFAKSCKLPDAIIDYSNPSGMVPTDSLKDYGELILLGAREADANGAVALKKISATATPTRIGGFYSGRLCLRSVTCRRRQYRSGHPGGIGRALHAVKPWRQRSLQLRALKQARNRVRLRIEQKAPKLLPAFPSSRRVRYSNGRADG